jgi:hypothetical protein
MVYIYKPSTQQISNQLITTFVSVEFINCVKITGHVSAHMEPSYIYDIHAVFWHFLVGTDKSCDNLRLVSALLEI